MATVVSVGAWMRSESALTNQRRWRLKAWIPGCREEAGPGLLGLREKGWPEPLGLKEEAVGAWVSWFRENEVKQDGSWILRFEPHRDVNSSCKSAPSAAHRADFYLPQSDEGCSILGSSLLKNLGVFVVQMLLSSKGPEQMRSYPLCFRTRSSLVNF